jgi:hypothetical protein
MNAIERICRWHRSLLRLYPASFKSEFGEELALVFEQAAEEAAQHGRWSLLRLLLHELGDLPWNILNQVWQNREVNAMFERFLSGGKNTRYRRAGAVGLAVSYGLMAVIVGFLARYQWMGVSSQKDFIPRLILAAVAGALGGAILGAACQPRQSLRGAVGLGVGFLLSRMVAYPLNLMTQDLNNLWQSILYLLITALMGIITSLAAGFALGGLGSRMKMLRLVGFGALGFMVARLAYDVINLAYTLGVFLLAGNVIPTFNSWLAFGFLVLGSIVQGYISGSWLGSACQPTGSLELRQVTT